MIRHALHTPLLDGEKDEQRKKEKKEKRKTRTWCVVFISYHSYFLCLEIVVVVVV